MRYKLYLNDEGNRFQGEGRLVVYAQQTIVNTSKGSNFVTVYGFDEVADGIYRKQQQYKRENYIYAIPETSMFFNYDMFVDAIYQIPLEIRKRIDTLEKYHRAARVMHNYIIGIVRGPRVVPPREKKPKPAVRRIDLKRKRNK